MLVTVECFCCYVKSEWSNFNFIIGHKKRSKHHYLMRINSSTRTGCSDNKNMTQLSSFGNEVGPGVMITVVFPIYSKCIIPRCRITVAKSGHSVSLRYKHCDHCELQLLQGVCNSRSDLVFKRQKLCRSDGGGGGGHVVPYHTFFRTPYLKFPRFFIPCYLKLSVSLVFEFTFS